MSKLVKLFDHQMGFERPVGAVAHRRNDVGPKGEIGHETAIHHIELEAIDASFVQGNDFVAKAAEVCRQDRRDNGKRAMRAHVQTVVQSTSLSRPCPVLSLPEWSGRLPSASVTSQPGADDPLVQVRAERMATGGEAVGRLEDGRVIFVRGALPGETVEAQIVEQKKRFVRGVAVAVSDASPERCEPVCSHAAAGQCGGCDWLHVRPVAQNRFKQDIVVEQLTRLGGIEDPQVSTVSMPRGRRTTVRCAVLGGRAGYRERRGSLPFAAESCQAAHPLVEELIVDGRFGSATEVTIRVGSETGERMVITDGAVSSVKVPSDVVVLSAADTAAIHEVVAGRRWRISAGSFFQTSHEGAEALVAAVARGLDTSEGPVVDLYGGVGLLGGGAVPGRVACLVESNSSSVGDAAFNLGDDVHVVEGQVERWRPTAFAGVIADPARRGLRKGGVAAIEGTAATQLVLVSCDPASLGRDASLLSAQGWRFEHCEVIDMFPDTNRIEAVSSFSR